MAKFQIYTTPEDRAMLSAEWQAHEENRRYDLLMSLRKRTMPKEMYYKVRHDIRAFFYGLKINQFIPGIL